MTIYVICGPKNGKWRFDDFVTKIRLLRLSQTKIHTAELLPTLVAAIDLNIYPFIGTKLMGNSVVSTVKSVAATAILSNIVAGTE